MTRSPIELSWTAKNLTFPNYEYGKGQYAFTPKNYLVSPKKLSVSKIPHFIRGDNYKTPRDQQKNQKPHFWEGSSHPNLLLNMVNYSTTTHLKKD